MLELIHGEPFANPKLPENVGMQKKVATSNRLAL